MEKGAEYYYGRKYCGQCVNGCGSYSRRLGIMERKQRQKTKGIRNQESKLFVMVYIRSNDLAEITYIIGEDKWFLVF